MKTKAPTNCLAEPGEWIQQWTDELGWGTWHKIHFQNGHFARCECGVVMCYTEVVRVLPPQDVDLATLPEQKKSALCGRCFGLVAVSVDDKGNRLEDAGS